MAFTMTSDHYVEKIATLAEQGLSSRWPGLLIANPILLFGIRQCHAEHLWLGSAEQYYSVSGDLKQKGFSVKQDRRFKYAIGMRLDIRQDVVSAARLALFVLLAYNDHIAEFARKD